MILNITSYPRSGNSFLTTQFLQFGRDWWYQPPNTRGRWQVTFRPVARLFAGELSWFDIERAPYHDKDESVPGQDRDKRPCCYERDTKSVYVYKRHDNPDDYRGPRIYLVRDGRDVLLSYAQHNLRNRLLISDRRNQDAIASMEIPIDWLNDEANRILNDPNANWGTWVERGLDNPNIVAVVRYEKLKVNPLFETMDALARAGYIVKKVGDPPSWAKLRAMAPQFYWKGIVGGHKILHPDIIRTFEVRNEHTLKRLRYL